MISADMATPRGLGAFVLAIEPEAFMGREAFTRVIRRYRDAIRASAVALGAQVLAAGDREWAEVLKRSRTGITLDPTALDAFAAKRGFAPLEYGPP